MTYNFKVKIAFNDETTVWRYVFLDSLPRSCGCDGSLDEWIQSEVIKEFGHNDSVEVLTYRQMNYSSKIGTRTLYLVHRHREYGGPEEGGWYYDHDEVLREYEVPAKSYYRHLERLQRYCEYQNKDLRSWESSQKLQVTAYKRQPTQRPHYC